MARYAAFLRGVSPMNCKMGELARAFEAAMQRHLGRSFMTLVRPLKALQALVEEDPFARHRLPAGAKRVVTFLAAAPRLAPQLPIALDGARILALDGLQAFSAYVPGPKGPVFMGPGPAHTAFASASGVRTAPIKARDDGKAGRLA